MRQLKMNAARDTQPVLDDAAIRLRPSSYSILSKAEQSCVIFFILSDVDDFTVIIVCFDVNVQRNANRFTRD